MYLFSPVMSSSIIPAISPAVFPDNNAVEAAGACVDACFLLGVIVPYLLFLKLHHCRRTFDKYIRRATNSICCSLYMPC